MSIINKIKCLIYSHDWEYMENKSIPEMKPYQSVYKCRRCGKTDKV